MIKQGVFSVNVSGNYFVVLDDLNGNQEKIHIKRNLALGALNGDVVSVKITKAAKNGKFAEGDITNIIERNTNYIIGVLERGRIFSILTPDDPRIKSEIYVNTKHVFDAKTGDKVVVKITKYPEHKDDIFKGIITEVLGRFDSPGVDILSIMRAYNLYENFPPAVEKNLEDFSDFVPEEDIKNRRDLRDLKIITIDGSDAKDLDDGVYVEYKNGVYRLIVAIADVSNYVVENSPLDVEALKRGTSVYLTDRVVPMLPKKLSNGLCSLNANTDRLALVADIVIDEKGGVIESKFYEAVINVKYRMTYNIVNKILEKNDKKFIEEYDDIFEMFQNLKKLRDILFKKREKNGAIEFETTEIKIKLDLEGKPVDVIKRETGISESIIEECMLIANEEVAKFLANKKIPAIYRVHPQPKEDAIDSLNEKISPLGFFLRKKKNAKINPKDVQEILEKSKNTPVEPIVNFLALRSMEKAYYSEINSGHFGLAKEFYTHFTSPIRRYPDLITHRILKEVLHNEIPQNKEKRLENLKFIAAESSKKERNAIEAERAVTDLKATEFMENYIGEEFEGIINSVTNFGMFITLDNGIEGLVHAGNMPRDRYVLNERNLTLVGERTKEEFKLGDRVKVAVLKTNLSEKTIDFILSEDLEFIRKKSENKTKKTKKSEKKKEAKTTKNTATFSKKSKKKALKEKRKFYKKIKSKKVRRWEKRTKE